MANILKSGLAILVGLVAYVGSYTAVDLVLRALFPERFFPVSETRSQDTAMLILELVFAIGATVAGCYLAAMLAPRAPKKHALILGAICFVLSILATLQVCLLYPWWYLGLGLVSIFPAAWFAGALRAARTRPELNKSATANALDLT